MSLTLVGVLVSVLGPVLLKLGFSGSCANEILVLAPVLVGGAISWIGRVRLGDLTVWGTRKPLE